MRLTYTHTHLPQLLKVRVATDVVVQIVPVVVVGRDRELGGDCLEGPALRGTAQSVGVQPGTTLQWGPSAPSRWQY